MLLAACSTNMPVSQVTVDPVKIIKIKPAKPSPLSPPNIDLKVLTKDTAKKLLEQNLSYICMSWEDYLSNGQFEKEKLAYIKQLINIIEFYEREDDVGKDTKDN